MKGKEIPYITPEDETNNMSSSMLTINDNKTKAAETAVEMNGEVENRRCPGSAVATGTPSAHFAGGGSGGGGRADITTEWNFSRILMPLSDGEVRTGRFAVVMLNKKIQERRKGLVLDLWQRG